MNLRHLLRPLSLQGCLFALQQISVQVCIAGEQLPSLLEDDRNKCFFSRSPFYRLCHRQSQSVGRLVVPFPFLLRPLACLKKPVTKRRKTDERKTDDDPGESIRLSDSQLKKRDTISPTRLILSSGGLPEGCGREGWGNREDLLTITSMQEEEIE